MHKDADRLDDRYPLAKRQCVGLGQATDPGNASYRPHGAERVWQRLETVLMDLSPLLSALDDGHEFAHNTGSLAMLREWIGRVVGFYN